MSTEPKRRGASPTGRFPGKAVTVRGVRYRSITAAAKAYGIDPLVVITRRGKGWKMLRALTQPVLRVDRSVRVRGRTYPSVSAACEAIGANYPRVLYRLRAGWSVPRAFNGAITAARSAGSNAQHNGAGRPHPIRFKGRTYPDREDAARALGLSPRLLRSLRARGLSDREAFAAASDRQGQITAMSEQREVFLALAEQREILRRPVEFKGVQYEGYGALGRAYGVRAATLSRRLMTGWTLEQALGQAARPKLVRRREAVQVSGRTFASISAAARHFGVDPSLARYRLTSGATPEEAFGVAPFKARAVQRGTPFTVAGKTYPSIKAACRQLKRSRALVQRRIATGESPEQAFDLEPPPIEHAKVVVDGRAFRFVAAAARYFKVDPVRVHSLVNQRQISAAEAIRIERERMAG